MDDQQKLQVFQAQTENVRELERAWNHLNRQINALILQKNGKSVEIMTRLLALVYCALTEATFSKMIHTPYSLDNDEIEQIKGAQTTGVKLAWLKCAGLAIRHIGGAKTSHAPNVLKKLTELIDQFVFDPSLIRNKIAHGQWAIALNRENTAVNTDLTQEIANLDVVELSRRKYALEKLALIVEDIIESPVKTHNRDFWRHLTELESGQKKMARWTFEDKVRQLFDKKERMRHGRPA